MTDTITLRRAEAERGRTALRLARKFVGPTLSDELSIFLAALDAALAEPEQKPEPVVVEQLFALAKLTVRRAADPDPWAWDRLADNGTWTPFNPLIHGPDMWRLEQALRAALAEPEPTVKDSLTVDHIRSIWLDSWKACGNVPTPVLAEHFARQIERALAALAEPDATREPATYEQVRAQFGKGAKTQWWAFRDGWNAAERFHGITKEDK